jgi:hypothetical protein
MRNKFIAVLSCLIAITTMASSSHAATTWAEKYAAFIRNSPADHTYVCINNGYGKRCYAYHGGNSGGSILNMTMGLDNSNKTLCLSTRPKQCSVIYGIEGVCHQEANRMLYPSRKLVTSARGYWYFQRYYGTYGNISAYWATCRQTCGV